MQRALVFGASGQIGTPLLRALRGAGWTVDAVSREARANSDDGVRWLRGGFGGLPELPEADAVLSCGPLDAFAAWFAHARPPCARVVAFGSTSVEAKRHSPDPAERALVGCLREAEARLFEAAAQRGTAATVLRPTLVYGAGRDANLTRIARMAARHRLFVLPRGASGLRQPVHVDDLAAAAMACLTSSAAAGRAYAVPGGETLPYREMVARVLASLSPPARLLEVPTPLFALAVRALRAGGRLEGFGGAALARLREDLVFDDAPARRDFGYAPRAFRPDASMFGMG